MLGGIFSKAVSVLARPFPDRIQKKASDEKQGNKGPVELRKACSSKAKLGTALGT